MNEWIITEVKNIIINNKNKSNKQTKNPTLLNAQLLF